MLEVNSCFKLVSSCFRLHSFYYRLLKINFCLALLRGGHLQFLTSQLLLQVPCLCLLLLYTFTPHSVKKATVKAGDMQASVTPLHYHTPAAPGLFCPLSACSPTINIDDINNNSSNINITNTSIILVMISIIVTIISTN